MERITATLLVMLLFLVSCSHGNKTTEPTARQKVAAGGYAFVDTSSFVLVKAFFPGQVPECEVYLWWEKNFGEPFKDVNGDGDYDPGIDIFIFSVNPELNMDLNHNSTYDGPNDPWMPGIPFDDIDGNGTLRNEMDAYRDYMPKVPFCDYNHNGRWDSLPAFTFYRMAKCRSMVQISGTYLLQFHEVDTAWYRFRSDSSVIYNVRGHGIRSPQWWYLPDTLRLPGLAFRSTARGLTYCDEATGVVIHITDSDLPDTVTNEDHIIVANGSVVPSHRSVQYEETLDTLGVRLESLLAVKISDLKVISPSTDIPRNAYWLFYFRKTEGLVAMHCNPFVAGKEAWIFFDSREPTIPCKMDKLAK